MNALGSFLTHRVTVRVAQLVIGAVLGWAALAKLSNLPAMAQQVHNFRLVPVAAENLVAIIIPWVELVAALALVLGVRARAGAIVATAAMTVFTVAVGTALARGLDFECGCFGTSDASRVGMAKVLENVGLLTVATVASILPRSSTTTRP